MGLIECRECRKQIGRKAKECPYCGTKNKRDAAVSPVLSSPKSDVQPHFFWNKVAIAVTIGIFLLTTLGSFIWFISKVDSRIEHFEQVINGKDGLRDQLKELGSSLNGKDGLKDQLRVINTRVELIEKQNDRDLRNRASKILKTSNVEIVRSGLLKDAKFSVPYEIGKDKTENSTKGTLFVRYSIESISAKGIAIRAQLERRDSQGQVLKSFVDQRGTIPLPSVGKVETLGFKLMGENFETPPVYFKFVVLERYGPDNLIVASAVTPLTSEPSTKENTPG
jgi:hypothetical protein